MNNNLNNKLTFWGSSRFSVLGLEELKKSGLVPALIITTPDQPTGRGLKLTPTPVKVWASENNIECLTPAKLDADFVIVLKKYDSSLFLVASYGKIIPQLILDLAKNGTLNIHPSLLPKYRGSSPLQTQILNDEKEVGVTIIKLDEKMDHGPIVAQKILSIQNWPVKFDELETITAQAGAKLFAENLSSYLEGKIIPKEQDHTVATFTKKVEKADGLIDIINGDPYKNFLKIQAYSTWPQAYFFVERKNNLTPTLPSTDGRETERIRVIVKEAKYADGKLEILKVLPEGKKEMNYSDFLRGLK
jgi:methionyl-tRNA formyltransferase